MACKQLRYNCCLSLLSWKRQRKLNPHACTHSYGFLLYFRRETELPPGLMLGLVRWTSDSCCCCCCCCCCMQLASERASKQLIISRSNKQLAARAASQFRLRKSRKNKKKDFFADEPATKDAAASGFVQYLDSACQNIFSLLLMRLKWRAEYNLSLIHI